MAKIELQKLIERSERNMGSGIHAVVKASAIEMIKRAYNEGIFVQITSGYRSFEEQTALYAKGRTAPGNVVTNAKAGQSNHNYGLAIDYVLLSEDGTKALWTVNNDWRRVAAIGKSLGFAWGGDWTSFKDYPHLEMMGGLSMRDLQAGKRPNLTLKFDGTVTTDAPKPKVKTEVVTSPKATKPSASKPKQTGDATIRSIQSTLNSRYKAGLSVDGIYGPNTKKALIKGYQTELNRQYGAKLAVDGVWGTKTKSATRTVRKGASGNITYILQAVLYCLGHNPKGVDGKFGANTESAVKSFQKAKGLAVDGIAGKNTFEGAFK